MKSLYGWCLLAGFFGSFVGALFEDKVAFPRIEERVRAEGFRAGVQAQAADVCWQLTEGQLPYPVLGTDGLLVACERVPEVVS